MRGFFRGGSDFRLWRLYWANFGPNLAQNGQKWSKKRVFLRFFDDSRTFRVVRSATNLRGDLTCPRGQFQTAVALRTARKVRESSKKRKKHDFSTILAHFGPFWPSIAAIGESRPL